MNWLLIVVLLLLALSIVHGYRKGLLRILFSMASWILLLVFVAWFKPYVNTYLTEHTSVYEKVENHCQEAVRQSSKKQLGNAAEGQADESGAQLAALGLNLPDNVLNMVAEGSANAADSILEESGVYSRIATGMADFVMEGISFFAALVVGWLFLHVISRMLGIVSHIPIVKGVNRFLGMFAGGIYGLVIVWVVFYIIALCSTSEIGSRLVSYIYASPFLTGLYQNNVVLTFILYFL
jgi:uncharacterized membrane protein required for colicin V production